MALVFCRKTYVNFVTQQHLVFFRNFDPKYKVFPKILLYIGANFAIIKRKELKWMCIALKYGIWNVGTPSPQGVNALVSDGYKPLSAMVLASRGISSSARAQAYLDCSAQLIDPYVMTDMGKAVERIRKAAATKLS